LKFPLLTIQKSLPKRPKRSGRSLFSSAFLFPIVLISGPGELNPLYAATLGVVSVLEKPLKINEILSKTATILDDETVLSGTGIPSQDLHEESEESRDIPAEEGADDLFGISKHDTAQPIHIPEGSTEQTEDTILAPDKILEIMESDQGHDNFDGDYFERRKARIKKNLILYAFILIFIGMGFATFIFTGTDEKFKDSLIKDTGEKEIPVKDTFAEVFPEETTEESASVQKDKVTEAPRTNEPGAVQGVFPEAVETVREISIPPDERDVTIVTQKRRRVLPKSAFRGKSRYYLQAGAYAIERNAASLSKTLKQKGYDVYVLRESRTDGTLLHRVLVGKFDKKGDARELSKVLLQKEGIRSFAVYEPVPDEITVSALPEDTVKAAEEQDDTVTPAEEKGSQKVARKRQRLLPKSYFLNRKKTYSLQVGAFKFEKNAAELSDRLKQKGYKAYILKELRANDIQFYRVLIGDFVEKNTALEQSEMLQKKEGIKSFINQN
jgi:cell division septation protein DedD